jgi:hypothetical protein
MHPVIAKTFGGLSRQYYFRQFFFGLLFPAMMFFMLSQGTHSIQISMVIFFAINTLLYPYSRFVYESVVGFIMGENVFFVNAIFMLFAKAITMAICWSAAILIAPIGLAYLYYHHSKG